jgi:hypothetical protein
MHKMMEDPKIQGESESFKTKPEDWNSPHCVFKEEVLVHFYKHTLRAELPPSKARAVVVRLPLLGEC